MGNAMEYLSGNRNVQYSVSIPGAVMFCYYFVQQFKLNSQMLYAKLTISIGVSVNQKVLTAGLLSREE